jgi:siroheme synthase-like protein
MPAFPLHFQLSGWSVLVVGAGPVGRRRVTALVRAGAHVTWVAPDVPATEGVRCVTAPFAPSDIGDARLVFACAPPAVNAEVVAAARARGVPVGRADAPGDGDFTVPAVGGDGDLLVSVTTGGRAPGAAAALAAHLPAHWPRFVGLVAEARARLAGHPERAARLRALANGPLLAILARGDGAEARRLVESTIAGDRQ